MLRFNDVIELLNHCKMASCTLLEPVDGKDSVTVEEESDMDTYKPLKVFIAQSMPIPKKTVLPSEIEVPSYCCSVLTGDIQLIEKARSEKKDINVTSNNTPRCLLHYGVLAEIPEEEKYCKLKKLVDLRADREQRDEHGRTPLHLAVLLGDTKAVDVLLKAGCDTTANCHGNNLMHLATISGNPDMFHKVRELGFDPRELTAYGFTSVHLAACYNQHQMIPLLKRFGVDVNQYSKPGSFNTQQATVCSILPIGFDLFKLYVLQNLCSEISCRYIGCRIDDLHKLNAETQQFVHNVSNHTNVIGAHPLMLATVFGFVPVVKELVENGADIDCVSPSGNTPLSLASRNGQLELVQFYFQKLNTLNNSLARSTLWQLIFLPTVVGAVDVVEFLVRSIGDLNVMSMHESGLHLSLADIAALTNQPEVLQLVLQMERERYIEESSLAQKRNYLLFWSIVGGWLFQVLSKRVPQFEVTKERQLAVMSTILNLPGCDPLQIVPLTRCSNVDMAILLSQSYALDILLSYLKERNVPLPSHSTISIPDHIQSLPLPHLCVRSVKMIEMSLMKLSVNALQNAHATILHEGYVVISQTIFSTFDILLKHSYSVNCLDSCGFTCLDYALTIKNVELQQFLHSHGAMLAGDLHDRKQLKDENEKLMIENQELRSQNEDLSRSITVIFELVSLLSSLFSPGSNPPSSVPFIDDEIRLDEGTLLDDEDVQLMAAKWWDIGTCLGLKLPILDNIKADHSRSCEQACREMLTRWCNRESRTGDKPRTLDVILEAMMQCGCEEYAKELEEKHNL